MASFDRLTVLNTIISSGLVPLFYNKNIEQAKHIITACVDGGASVMEFTNRGDRAFEVFTELIPFVEGELPSLIVGVGSILDAATAAMYISSGANFVVGPVFVPEVAKCCNRHKIAYLPGCGTVTEISNAEELGVEIVKIFPGAQVGGPSFIKAILGPMPWTRIMPTGGVDATKESVQSWIDAGAVCVGMGSKLIKNDFVQSRNYKAIASQVKEVLEWIAEIREK